MPDKVKPLVRAAVAAHVDRIMEVLGEHADSPQLVLEAAVHDELQNLVYGLVPRIIKEAA